MSVIDKLASRVGGGTSSRTRGRPCRGMAAQIDQEIIQAARSLFLSLGYERTSMAMITRAAGVSKTTLYSRYETKADLFLASVRFTVGKIANQTLSPAQARKFDLSEGLRVFGRNAIRISIAPVWSKYERLVYAEGLRFPELTSAVAERIDVGIDTVESFIVGCAEREGKTLSDARRVATTYVMAIRGFYAAAVLRGADPSEGEIAAFVDDLVDLPLASRSAW